MASLKRSASPPPMSPSTRTTWQLPSQARVTVMVACGGLGAVCVAAFAAVVSAVAKTAMADNNLVIIFISPIKRDYSLFSVYPYASFAVNYECVGLAVELNSELIRHLFPAHEAPKPSSVLVFSSTNYAVSATGVAFEIGISGSAHRSERDSGQ